MQRGEPFEIEISNDKLILCWREYKISYERYKQFHSLSIRVFDGRMCTRMAFNLKKILSSLSVASNEVPHKVVGIDFGSSSVKVVEVDYKDNVLALGTYGELQLGPYGDADLGSTVDLNIDKRIEAAVDAIRESGVTAKKGVLALPLSESFVTVISLNLKNGEDLRSKVHVEARKYIPVPLADVKLEWSELQQIEDPKNPPLTRDVLLAAIQNTALAEMKQMLDVLQMQSQPSEIELFSTLRAVTRETDTSLAVIDLGAHMSKLYISQDGFLQRIHRVATGGAQVTTTLAHGLSIPFEDAENMKRNVVKGGEHSDEIEKLMRSTFNRPLMEFKRVLKQHELRTGTPIARVVLTGGSSSFNGFVEYAKYVLDRDVMLANPFSKVAYPAFMEDTLTEIGPLFSVALGAALRAFE